MNLPADFSPSTQVKSMVQDPGLQQYPSPVHVFSRPHPFQQDPTPARTFSTTHSQHPCVCLYACLVPACDWLQSAGMGS